MKRDQHEHESDRVVEKIVTDANGFQHELTHCIHCGAEMTKPKTTQPHRSKHP